MNILDDKWLYSNFNVNKTEEKTGRKVELLNRFFYSPFKTIGEIVQQLPKLWRLQSNFSAEMDNEKIRASFSTAFVHVEIDTEKKSRAPLVLAKHAMTITSIHNLQHNFDCFYNQLNVQRIRETRSER